MKEVEERQETKRKKKYRDKDETDETAEKKTINDGKEERKNEHTGTRERGGCCILHALVLET